MLIFIVVIKINRSGEPNLKARGSRRARLTTTGKGEGEAGGAGLGRRLRLNYLDPPRQPHITVTSLFGRLDGAAALSWSKPTAMDVC